MKIKAKGDWLNGRKELTSSIEGWMPVLCCAVAFVGRATKKAAQAIKLKRQFCFSNRLICHRLRCLTNV